MTQVHEQLMGSPERRFGRDLASLRMAIDGGARVRQLQQLRTSNPKERRNIQGEIDQQATSTVTFLGLEPDKGTAVKLSLVARDLTLYQQELMERLTQVDSTLIWFLEMRKPDQTVGDFHRSVGDGDIRLTMEQNEQLERLYAARI